MARAAKSAEPGKTKTAAKPAAAAGKQAKTKAPVPATAKTKTAAEPVPPAGKPARTKAASPIAAKAKGDSAKATAPAAKPAKAAVVTLKHLAAGVAEVSEMPRRDAEQFALSLISTLVQQIKGGAKVRIAGLGVLEIKDRPARMGRNPATGEAVQIAASRKIVFRAAKDLKEAV